MAIKRFMIAPLSAGMITESKPWLIADNAYERLYNVYSYYGRVRKRVGATVMNTSVNKAFAQLYSRLGMNLDTTDGGGDAAFVVPQGGVNANVGQIFGVGTQALGHEIFTVVSALPGAQPMLASGFGNGTFNITTGAVVINNSITLAPVYWYPALPAIGLPQYKIGTLDDWPTFGFDTRYAYQYIDSGNGARWELAGNIPPAAGSYLGTGADFNLIWPLNYRGAGAADTLLFVTNNVDPIRYFANGAPSIWNAVAYLPQYALNAAQTIQTCLAMVNFKGRLLLFNTLENQVAGPAIRFPQRYRYTSANVNPLDLANAFNVEPAGNAPRAGFDDAPTKERITSIALLKDRLIVSFEQSEMEVVYTGNDASPFRWQTINSELGVDSTFSPVLFDKSVIAIGKVGIHANNGTNVERIDENVRQFVFQINNQNEGRQRTYGVRDYENELIYWSYPSEESSLYPDSILVYNYRAETWAYNDDSVTCFGYFNGINSVTWADLQGFEWQDVQLAWNAPDWQGQFSSVIAGNQEGFTFLISSEASKNSAALSITNIVFANPNQPTLFVINHNLLAGEFIYIENATGNNIADMNGTIYEVIVVADANTIAIFRNDTAGQTYTGGATITRVSNPEILTKQFNFFQQDGRNAYISKVDFNVDRTANGEITVDFLTSTSNTSLLDDGQITGSILGTSVLETTPYTIYPFEATQAQLWHTVYFQGEGEYVQFNLYLSEQQMLDPDIAFSDFELNAFTIYAEPTSTRLQ